MITITGKYTTALCYCDEIDDSAKIQIQAVCDTEFSAGSKIRIMPDVHAGKGCTIGTTMTVKERVVPNLVGADIGCGMFAVNLGQQEIDLALFDEAAHFVPSGISVWSRRQKDFDLTRLYCFIGLSNTNRIAKSLGTLGGGNHFIEIDRADDGTHYLVIHSGSRSLGRQVSEIYQHIAVTLDRDKSDYQRQRSELIRTYKEQGRQTEIQEALKNIAPAENFTPEDLCSLEGEYFEKYIHDLKICQEFAKLNRELIAEILLARSGILTHSIHELDSFHTIHNYIDTDEMILRKGAVPAHSGERLLIPLNMRDGALICSGKGNPEWNCSAPHGAGRILSRAEAQKTLTIEQFRKEMSEVYTTCIEESTLDESPMAYKNPDAIVKNIAPTAEILSVIKPVYNFKASGQTYGKK